ncbi:MAG: hypothetical protein ACO3QA_10700, partial [Phycisphaerales bacterium]
VISRRDGSLVSSFPARASVEADPVIIDGRVYFVDTGGNTWCYDLDGTLVAIGEGSRRERGAPSAGIAAR